MATPDHHGTRTVTTITFGSRNSDPFPFWALGVLAAFGLALIAVLVLAVGGARVGFDGMLGDGCDAGNRLCTFTEWRKGCDVEDVRAHVCTLPEFVRRGGSAPVSGDGEPDA